MDRPLHVVTGAFGYTGRALAERLLSAGVRVRTLTNSPDRANPFQGCIEVRPLSFRDPAALEDALRGAAVLYNTYWVRFNHALFSFEEAVANTRALFDAARRAGVGRIVHVSILNPDDADDLPYYRGKRLLERDLGTSGLPHSIIRPGVLFGRGDILVNNIAWALRRLPVFGVFGDGQYKLRPLHVDDMADLMIRHAGESGNTAADAVGPERYAYRDLATMLARVLGVRRPIVPVPASVGLAVARALGPIVRDVVLTREEVAGLMRGLLDSDAPTAGPTKLSEWASAHRAALGVRYASEVGRRRDRRSAYADVR